MRKLFSSDSPILAENKQAAGWKWILTSLFSTRRSWGNLTSWEA
ncbi:hypothetical protein HMPREF0620_1491 [Parascardovia denticolens DSM 10105 = JCM 12538]|uniref:Uncharacterized protein n=1 Tax=Parascardovia denticolens DSM 10105 = JCM 12538 TaxID=864564 RepID=E6K218_PARDN|nr:hypothetical protein HMPREF0620_1491 [Parascardovia denticolens DSM 10105 = JCM 12538]